MFSRWNSLLNLLALTAIALLAYDLFVNGPTTIAITGLSLVMLTSLGYALSLRHLRRNAFRTVMSTYADRQMHRESQVTRSSFDAPSAAA